MPDSAVAAYVFGPFRLDLEASELRKDAEPVEIRPKVLELLLFLLRNRGKLLTKETLLQHVWGDVIVSETSLTRTVADLRELLGDDPDNPHYIQTAPKRGYKFVAAVEEVKSAPAARAASAFSLVHGGKEYRLHEGDQMIGRGKEVEIPLFTALTSRHHARVHVAAETVTLQDLGSTNGTSVNGTRLSGSIELKQGDHIEIGGELLVLWSPTSPTAPAHPGSRK